MIDDEASTSSSICLVIWAGVRLPASPFNHSSRKLWMEF